MYPLDPPRNEDSLEAVSRRKKVNAYDKVLSSRPHQSDAVVVMDHLVQSKEENYGELDTAAAMPISTMVQNSDDGSCGPAESIEGLSSLDDMVSVIDGSESLQDIDFSKQETKDVVHLKMLVFFILVASASTLAACVYVYIVRSETSQFESKFSNDASKVLQAIGSSLDRTLGELDNLAVNMVSYAQDENLTWPKVTYPNFGVKMAKTLPLTDAFIIVELPIVYPEKRKEWEEYSILHDDWVNQSMAIQETWNGFYGPIIYDWEPRGAIHGVPDDIEANVRYA
jgi:hypothetical protein